nr:conjugal transfer protein TraF [uncultured bacterium]BAH89958.1 putative conjugal transfer protein TraF [uncultured bacterium]BAH90062.1 conjugal transfer protein TraF [uncultured bacterium]BAH90324.1 conjugal transfer protein TraF [uncultured bacterium]
MTAPTTTANAPAVAPRPHSRLRARIAVATLAALGFAALAWAAFVSPLPRLTYNPSDSVAVGWYRIDPFDPRTASLPRPLSVDSTVLVPLPATAAALAAQRGYLPTRVPLRRGSRLRQRSPLTAQKAFTSEKRSREPLGCAPVPASALSSL